MTVQIIWCFWNCIRGWSAEQNIVNSMFLLIGVITVITSFTESYLYSVFDINAILFFCAAIIPISNSARMHEVMMPVRLDGSAPSNVAV